MGNGRSSPNPVKSLPIVIVKYFTGEVNKIPPAKLCYNPPYFPQKASR
jgi:hypothetical protein